MNASTQRVLKALKREHPDRIPTYEWFWPEFMEIWKREKGDGEDIHEYYDIDIRSIAPDIAPDPSLFEILAKTDTGTVFRNGWGMVCRKVHGAAMLDFLEHPIRDERDFSCYRFVDAGWAPRFSTAYVDDLSLGTVAPFEEEATRLGKKRFVLGCVLDPYECLWRLRGVESVLMDFLDRPDFLDLMIARVTDFMTELGLRQIEIGRVAGIFILGDVAYKNGPLFSPRLYREKILPGLASMCSQFKKHGASVFYHTDGDCTSLIDMFLEAGIDALNPVESAAGMDLQALNQTYGRRLAYMGGFDKRKFIDVRELEKEVRTKAGGFAAGGLIACVDHSVGPEIPIGNYEHYVALIHDYSDKGRIV